MKLNPKDNKIYFTKGTASKIGKGGVKESVDSIPFTDPSCGCGIDCCYGILVLPNYSSVTGDVLNYQGAFFLDGELEFGPLDEIKAQVKSLKGNVLISPTSASISGCVGNITLPGTRQLTAVVYPSYALQTGTWAISNPSVATINTSTGLVTGVGAGAATVSFTTSDGSVSTTCTVTVVED